MDATPAQALIVKIRRENGRPLTDEAVHFSATVEGSGFSARPTILVGSVESTGFAAQMVDSTNAEGRVAARIKMGRRAGSGAVVVTVPVEGIRDTAHFTIEPGAVVRVTASPADTVLFVDRSYTLSAELLDRYGNPLTSGSAAFEAEGEVVAVSDGEVTGARVGRAEVVVRSGEYADTARVSVVPQGEFAVLELSFGWQDEVVLLGLDGSNPRAISTVGSGAQGLISWAPDARSIVVWDGDTRRLRVVDVEGRDRRLMPTPVADAEAWPHFSRDGQWIYWSGDPGSGERLLYRVKPDGSGAEQIGPAAGHNSQPTPSPTGDRLAYLSSGSSLRILDIATGVSTDLGISADRPRWSPTDDRIAFTADRHVKIARPDGTVTDVTAGSAVEYRGGLAWSPDGRWLLVATYRSGLELLDPETGESIPLPYTNRDMSHPGWRPTTGG